MEGARGCLRPRRTYREVVRVVVIRSGSEGGAVASGGSGGGSGGDGEQDDGGYCVGEDFVEVMLTEYSLCGGHVFHERGGVKVEVFGG